MKAKQVCPKCGEPMSLISTGYKTDVYHCEVCKTNTQVEKEKA
jgi:tRNA(Ile2) C34 agmatinyltransferase TiaS